MFRQRMKDLILWASVASLKFLVVVWQTTRNCMCSTYIFLFQPILVLICGVVLWRPRHRFLSSLVIGDLLGP